MNMLLTPVVRNLLLINLAIFIIDHYVFDLTGMFGLRYVLAPEFNPVQFFMYMFLHADWSHVFFNMFALFVFGPMLEKYWGPKKFLIFYLACGIGAGVIYSGISFYQMFMLHSGINEYAMHPTPTAFAAFIRQYAPSEFNAHYDFMLMFDQAPDNPSYITSSLKMANDIFHYKASIPLIGASGAVFGILMAFGLMFPNMELFIFPLPIPVKAKYYVLGYGLIELYSGVHQSGNDNVAHFAHIGGMIVAFFLIRLWRNKGEGSNYY